MQALPGMQSLSVWQGQAHFWAATLQRWVRQLASIVQGRAKGLGVESVALEAVAVGEDASDGVNVVASPIPGACVVGPLGGAGAGAAGG